MTSRLRAQQKATKHATRWQNRRLVLQHIMAEGTTSRADISRSTGLTRATVSQLVGELLDAGLVDELGSGPSAGGKPPTLLGLNAAAHSVLAVDLSDGRRIGSVLDLEGSAAYRTAEAPSVARGPDGIDELIETIDELLAAAAQPLGIGIGTPGVVDDDGTVVEASNLGWRDVPLGRILAERFDLPVHVLNNSRAAAIAEYSFGGHGAENMLVVKIGNGIGAGVVLDGHIMGGEDAAAGEIGHVVVDPSGPRCFCGRAGCLETLVSVPRLAALLRPLVGSDDDSEDVILEFAAREDTPDVARVLDEAARNLGTVLSTTVAILDIHRVVISGLISRLGDRFLDRVRAEVESRVLPTLAAKVDLGYATTGDRAVRMGAAAFVLHHELGVL